jgi:late competence protein required for DNA uptake (superfamily II DNA/RNA helicase)
MNIFNAFFHIEEKIKKNNLKVNCDSCGATHINKNNNNWTHLENGEDICRKCIKVNNKKSLKKVSTTA